MRKNEPTAAQRVAGPVPVYDLDGALKKNLTFLTASSQVFIYRKSTNDYVPAANDAFEQGGANTTGKYMLQLTQAETNYDSVIGIKLVYTGGGVGGADAIFFWDVSVDNTPDVNVATMATDSMSAAAASAAYVAKLQAGLATGAQVSNIAVTGAALNTTATSRTITSGSGAGGVANTTGADQTYDSISDTAGAIDFYYEFDVSATSGAVGVSCQWFGYLDDPTNVNSLKTYAYNWGGASYDQIGLVPGAPTPVESTLEFALTSAHTGTGGNLGKVRIRFAKTGLVSAVMKTDRILLGYAVVVTPAAIAAVTAPAVWEETRVAHVTVGTMGEGVKVKTHLANAIDVSSFESPTFQLLNNQLGLGYLVVSGSPSPTRTTLRVDVGLGTDFLKGAMLQVMENTGVNWFATVKSYDTSSGDTVLDAPGFSGLVDATSVIAAFASEAPAARIRDAEITPEKFSALTRKRLFGEVWNGMLAAFGVASATLTESFTDHVLRGTLLNIYDGDGAGQCWQISDNIGAICTLSGGDAWSSPPTLVDADSETRSQVEIVRYSDALGTLFNRGGAERTAARQQVCGLADVHLGEGTNIGQPDVGNPAVAKDEAGVDVLEWDVPKLTGTRTRTWDKSAP